MNSFNHSGLVKRTVALLGMTGLAAFSGLPALAQLNNNNTNNGVSNSVNCSAYVNGGVGGPIDNSNRSSDDTATIPQNRPLGSLSQSNTNYPPGVLGSSAVSANQGNTNRSSDDTAMVPQNRLDAMNSNNSSSSYRSNGMRRDGQFSAENSNAAIPFRSNGPAGTSGGESNLNLRVFSANNGNPSMQSTMMGNTSYRSNGMRRDGQFSAENSNAAIPFRSNGPAGTSGGESNLNLRVFSANNGNLSMQSTMMGNNNRAYSAPNQSSSYQSANPIPVECLPGAVNQR